MSSLHMIEVRPDVKALLHFLKGQGLAYRESDEDLGYGVHAWLSAAFGDMVPKPWRLLHDARRPTRILGYCKHAAPALRLHLSEFTDPSVFAVCPDPEILIASREMPVWCAGRRLAFEVQCCPVGRKSRSGVEKDLFLMRADEGSQHTLSRDDVYSQWATERLERNDAAIVKNIYVAGFRLVRQLRQTRPSTEDRRRHHLIRPLVLLRGELVINNSEEFSTLLANGLGRHRSFGYGMLLLRPPT